MRCAVKSCNSKYEKSKNNKSFFQCPRNKLLKQKWIQFLGGSVKFGDNTRVCEDHFSKEEIIGQLQCALGVQRKLRLRVGTVPTIVSSSADENLNSVGPNTDDNSNESEIQFDGIIQYDDDDDDDIVQYNDIGNEVNLNAAKDSYEDNVEAEILNEIQNLKSELSALQKKYDELESAVHSKELNFKEIIRKKNEDIRKLQLNHRPDWPCYICKRCDDNLNVSAGIEQAEQTNNAQSVLESTAPESIEEEVSCDEKSESNKQNKILMCPGEELVQAEIKSSEEEEYMNCLDTKIYWDLLTEEEAKQLLRDRNKKSDFCDQCGKHVSHLKNHLQRHAGEKKFECKLCEKRFKTQIDLRIHDKTVHSVTNHLNCRFCDMAFKAYAQRMKHERRLHTLERPYKCRHCEKAFLNCTHRKNHETTHFDIRNYHCEVCDVSFKTQTTFYCHTRSKKHKSREEAQKEPIELEIKVKGKKQRSQKTKI